VFSLRRLTAARMRTNLNKLFGQMQTEDARLRTRKVRMGITDSVLPSCECAGYLARSVFDRGERQASGLDVCAAMV